MIASMTGYARSEKTTDDLRIVVEIRAYNSRNLDMVPRLPRDYIGLEDRVKQTVARQIARGRVELYVQIDNRQEQSNAFEVDEGRVRSYIEALNRLFALCRIESAITPELLLAAGNLIHPVENAPDLEAVWVRVEDCLNTTLADLIRMRQTEGAFLAKDLEERLALIESLIDRIAQSAGELAGLYRQKLQDRIAHITRGLVEIDPGRLAQEAAFLADRSDISEEIVRARSHAGQFRKIMRGDEPGGRKLNFLLQEFGREFNTMGSKAADAAMAHFIVDAKSELEKMREQVQNIE
jgi:uncharacterized protein (TIGR00255 family)